MPHLSNSGMHNAQHGSAQTVSSELEGANSGDDYNGLVVDSVSNSTTMFFSSRNIVSRKNVDRNAAINTAGLSKPLTGFYSSLGHHHNLTLNEDHYKIRGSSQSAGIIS